MESKIVSVSPLARALIGFFLAWLLLISPLVIFGIGLVVPDFVQQKAGIFFVGSSAFIAFFGLGLMVLLTIPKTISRQVILILWTFLSVLVFVLLMILVVTYERA